MISITEAKLRKLINEHLGPHFTDEDLLEECIDSVIEEAKDEEEDEEEPE